jgi:hypothetical protein
MPVLTPSSSGHSWRTTRQNDSANLPGGLARFSTSRARWRALRNARPASTCSGVSSTYATTASISAWISSIAAW